MIISIIVFGILGALAGSEWTIARYLQPKEKGGKFPVSLTWLPEFIMALIAGTLTCNLFGWNDTFIHFIINLVMIGYYYAWIQTGRHDALDVGSEVGRKVRDNTLTPVALWISNRFGWERDSLQYDLTFWGVMGFILTLPLGGLWGAVLMPLGCYLAVKTRGLEKSINRYSWHFTRAFLMYGLSFGVPFYVLRAL